MKYRERRGGGDGCREGGERERERERDTQTERQTDKEETLVFTCFFLAQASDFDDRPARDVKQANKKCARFFVGLYTPFYWRRKQS